MSKAILPFPAEIDRDYFGAYLSGFVDGEACFRLLFVQQNQGRCRRTPAVSFAIILRADDTRILQLIQSYWQCGRLYGTRGIYSARQKPRTIYITTRIAEAAEVVVPHFERFPLLAKKVKDFAIWKEGVALVHRIVKRGRCHRWTDEEIAQFTVLHDLLRSQREYEAPELPMPPPSNDFPLFQ